MLYGVGQGIFLSDSNTAAVQTKYYSQGYSAQAIDYKLDFSIENNFHANLKSESLSARCGTAAVSLSRPYKQLQPTHGQSFIIIGQEMQIFY